MQVRRIGSRQIWLKAPFSPDVLLMVWTAMAAQGLRQGVIDTEQNLIEGYSAQGLLADNARVQAKVESHAEGTLISFEMKSVGASDWVFSTYSRRFIKRITQFFRGISPDWNIDALNDSMPVAPLSDPTGELARKMESPTFGLVIPIHHLHWDKRALLICGILAVGASLWNLWGPLSLIFAAWLMWNHKKGAKFEWAWFLGAALFGIRGTWILVSHWF